MLRSRRLLLLLFPLGASFAWATPNDWKSCMPLAAGACASVSDLNVTGTLKLNGATTGTGTVTSTNILDGTITTADINASAGILGTQLDPAAGIAAGQITDITRSIPLPLGSWVPCTGQGIWTTDGTDTKPNLTVTPTGVLAIVYDATGGSVDTGTVCNSFIVPADYISGGSFKARATQGAATVTNIETFSCAISVDGATLGSPNAGNLVNQTAVQTVTSTPAGTWAVGKAIQVACSQGNASADDTVNFLAIEAQYTASE